MKTSSLQFKVLSLVAAAMAISLAVSILSLTRVYGSIQELDRISREDFQSQAALLQALVNFKNQVQEWKNVLLRGQDPKALDKYWGQFLKQEKDTVDTMREARAGIRDTAILAKLEHVEGRDRPADRLAFQDEGCAGRGGAPGALLRGSGRHRVQPGRRRHHRPLAAHRGAGFQPRADRRQHGGAFQHGEAERRQRA